MFFYKDEFHPLLNSHPDIQKAWKAWDDIIFLWDKISKSELCQNAKNASCEDNGKSAGSHHVKPDSESKANSTHAELERATEIVSIQNPGVDAKDFKDMSIQQWLERQNCNDDVMAVFDSMYCQTVAAAPRQMGLYECAREENAWTYGDGNFRLAGSYSLLVEHFLKKCSEVEKRLCWQVTEVNWKGENGKDKKEKQGESKTGGRICLKNQLGQTLTAKYVIMTVPLTILKDGDINFIPPLPASKKRAIDGIEMRGALKIVCRFKSQFWPDNLNLIYRVRGFVSQIWMYTYDSMKSAEKCHLIAGFQTAEPAEQKINLSEQEVLDGFLQDLDHIFRTASNLHPATDSFTDYVYYHWSKHPFIRGGYSSPTVHANGLRHELGRPVEDHLFFAGEATSVTACATVHTAIETGLRAAREVCSIVTRVITESVMPEK